MNLNITGGKLGAMLKRNKNYSNIPFGKSLLDVFWDDDKGNFILISKSPSKGLWTAVEHTQSSVNLPWKLQDYHFDDQWENSDDMIEMTPELLKAISQSIAEISRDIIQPQETIVFPFFQYMIVVKCCKNNEGEDFKGAAYIFEFNNENNGYGGSVNEISDIGEHLDFAIFKTLNLSFENNVFQPEQYDKIQQYIC